MFRDDDNHPLDYLLPDPVTESQPSREVRRQERRDRIAATLYMLAFWALVILLTGLIAAAFAEPAALAIHPDCPTASC